MALLRHSRAETTDHPPATSLARLVPDAVDLNDRLERRVLALHLERYRFAEQMCRGRRVLDLACGAGYGAARLARVADRVTAVDAEPAAIEYARTRYHRDNLEYFAGPYEEYGSEGPGGAPFEVIVSLETIAHVHSYHHFLNRLHAWTLPVGRLILSAPVTPSRDFSPAHLHDVTADELRRLLTRHGFAVLDWFAQTLAFDVRDLIRSFRAGERRHGWQTGLRRNLAAFYRHHPDRLAARLRSWVRHGLSCRYLTFLALPLPPRG
jgi:2-polyprenyl-3-methyl-5-hydroxy-6-metoxy-1,4-benzoquinol methylase